MRILHTSNKTFLRCCHDASLTRVADKSSCIESRYKFKYRTLDKEREGKRKRKRLFSQFISVASNTSFQHNSFVTQVMTKLLPAQLITMCCYQTMTDVPYGWLLGTALEYIAILSLSCSWCYQLCRYKDIGIWTHTILLALRWVGDVAMIMEVAKVGNLRVFGTKILKKISS